jgi:hypothetical protein
MEKVIYWLGVVGGILAGVVAIVGAIITKHVAYAAWGVTFIAGSIIAAVSGAKARPDGSLSPLKVGAVFKEIPTGAWVVIAALGLASIVVTVIFPPFN